MPFTLVQTTHFLRRLEHMAQKIQISVKFIEETKILSKLLKKNHAQFRNLQIYRLARRCYQLSQKIITFSPQNLINNLKEATKDFDSTINDELLNEYISKIIEYSLLCDQLIELITKLTTSALTLIKSTYFLAFSLTNIAIVSVLRAECILTQDSLFELIILLHNQMSTCTNKLDPNSAKELCQQMKEQCKNKSFF
eukprot:TRINITY_DN4_c0_g1_i1.p1 TRINITY_DN4_c0_g1~~TRINITY_DN4_c0_g1_i1.p1  ORF type:complete len:208 (+),score=39.96 TRINITY_DN4_c0_g1_i1:39-626(+)